MIEGLASAELASWVASYGIAVYGVLLLYALLKPGTLPFFAGIIAQNGVLDIAALVPLMTLGTFIGDGIKFYLGRRYGLALLASWPSAAARTVPIGAALARHHRKILMLYRLCFGIRVIVPIAAGMSPLPARQYLLINLISAVFWNCGLLGLGYGIGHAAEDFFGDKLSLVALAFFLLSLILSVLTGRRLKQNPIYRD